MTTTNDNVKVQAQKNLFYKEEDTANPTLSEFNKHFKALVDFTGDIYYCSVKEFDALNKVAPKKDKAKLNDYGFLSGMLTRFPIPTNANVKFGIGSGDYTFLGLNLKKHREVIPYLMSLKKDSADSEKGFEHEEEDYPTLTGTNCSELMSSGEFQPYFEIIKKDNNTMIPVPVKNDVYEGLVIKYNQQDKLYLTPVVTPIYAVIYIVSHSEDKLLKFIKDGTDPKRAFSLALNGFIIPIDKWDASVYFLPIEG